MQAQHRAVEGLALESAVEEWALEGAVEELALGLGEPRPAGLPYSLPAGLPYSLPAGLLWPRTAACEGEPRTVAGLNGPRTAGVNERERRRVRMSRGWRRACGSHE